MQAGDDPRLRFGPVRLLDESRDAAQDEIQADEQHVGSAERAQPQKHQPDDDVAENAVERRRMQRHVASAAIFVTRDRRCA